ICWTRTQTRKTLKWSDRRRPAPSPASSDRTDHPPPNHPAVPDITETAADASGKRKDWSSRTSRFLIFRSFPRTNLLKPKIKNETRTVVHEFRVGARGIADGRLQPAHRRRRL